MAHAELVNANAVSAAAAAIASRMGLLIELFLSSEFMT
jgi:hypothetical protein